MLLSSCPYKTLQLLFCSQRNGCNHCPVFTLAQRPLALSWFPSCQLISKLLNVCVYSFVSQSYLGSHFCFVIQPGSRQVGRCSRERHDSGVCASQTFVRHWERRLDTGRQENSKLYVCFRSMLSDTSASSGNSPRLYVISDSFLSSFSKCSRFLHMATFSLFERQDIFKKQKLCSVFLWNPGF